MWVALSCDECDETEDECVSGACTLAQALKWNLTAATKRIVFKV